MTILYAAVYFTGELLVEYSVGVQSVFAKNMRIIVNGIPCRLVYEQQVVDVDTKYYYSSMSDGTVFTCVATKSTKPCVAFSCIKSIISNESDIGAYLSNGSIKDGYKQTASTIMMQKVAYYNDSTIKLVIYYKHVFLKSITSDWLKKYELDRLLE